MITEFTPVSADIGWGFFPIDMAIRERDNVRMADRTTSNGILITIGVVVTLLVVVAVVFALQPPTEFDPNTPQGTAQGYFQAINDGDEDLAETFMTNDIRTSCNGHWWYEDTGSDSRVVIVSTEIDGDTAKVEVDISVSYGDGLFGGGSYDQEETITMERSGEVWLISRPVWPMDRYACGEGDF